jgi:hypothetical protein
MKTRKNRSLAPWVVDQKVLVDWVQNHLPVRYNRKNMYLHGMVPQMKNGKRFNGKNHVMLFDYSKEGEDRIVIAHRDDITLLI